MRVPGPTARSASEECSRTSRRWRESASVKRISASESVAITRSACESSSTSSTPTPAGPSATPRARKIATWGIPLRSTTPERRAAITITAPITASAVTRSNAAWGSTRERMIARSRPGSGTLDAPAGGGRDEYRPCSHRPHRRRRRPRPRAPDRDARVRAREVPEALLPHREGRAGDGVVLLRRPQDLRQPHGARGRRRHDSRGARALPAGRAPLHGHPQRRLRSRPAPGRDGAGLDRAGRRLPDAVPRALEPAGPRLRRSAGARVQPLDRRLLRRGPDAAIRHRRSSADRDRACHPRDLRRARARARRRLPAAEPERRGALVLRSLLRPPLGRAPGPRPRGRLPPLPDAGHAGRRARAAPARVRGAGREVADGDDLARRPARRRDLRQQEHLLHAGARQRLRHAARAHHADLRRRAGALPAPALHLPRGERRLDRADARAPRPPPRDLPLGGAAAQAEALRVLPAPVLDLLRSGREHAAHDRREPHRRGGPHHLGQRLSAPGREDPRRGRRAARGDGRPRPGRAGAHSRAQRRRALRAAGAELSSGWPGRRWASTGLLGLALGAPAARSAGYEELRAAAVELWRAIDPDEYQSGLLFNPDGDRSYYVRSECFQRAAVQFRDSALCAGVKRRYSLFSSSWGYSAGRCRELVAEGAAADRAALEEMRRLQRRDPVRLRGFRLERNGNGRDYDVVPSFSGSHGHGHLLRVEAVGAGTGAADALLHASGYYVDGGSELRIFLRQDEIRRQIPGFAPGRTYSVRVTLVLDVGNGGPAGYWSDAFVESVFPTRERSHFVEQEVRF